MAKKKAKKKIYGIPYGLVVSSMRLIWMKSTERREAVSRSRKKLLNPKTDRIKQFPTCEKCGEIFYEEKGYAVHHINPVGSVSVGADIFLERLFCPSDQLIVLCKTCHDKVHNKNQNKKK